MNEHFHLTRTLLIFTTVIFYNISWLKATTRSATWPLVNVARFR